MRSRRNSRKKLASAARNSKTQSSEAARASAPNPLSQRDEVDVLDAVGAAKFVKNLARRRGFGREYHESRLGLGVGPHRHRRDRDVGAAEGSSHESDHAGAVA